MANQEGDIRIFQTENNGDISVSGGFIEMDSGLESAVYLSLFGGNEQDDGAAGNATAWWGNGIEQASGARLISRTQNLLQSMPITTGNVEKLRLSVLLDLESMKDSGVFESIDATITIPALNTVGIRVDFVLSGEKGSFYFKYASID